MSALKPVRSVIASVLVLLTAAPAISATPWSGRDTPPRAEAKPIRTAHLSAAEESTIKSLDEGKDDGLCGHARRGAKLLSGDGPGAPGAPREGDQESDVTHYLLDIEIIPEYSGMTVTNVRVEGVSTITAEAAVDGLTTFTIDLAANLTVNSVTGNVASWSRVGDTIVTMLDHTYDLGESFLVAVDYQGYPQDGGWGAFRWWLRNDHLAVGTLSEPFYARYWWPCKDALLDKATMQMHCTVPNGMVVASNGVLEGTDAVGVDRTRFRWRVDYPMITYLASLAITNYQRYDITYSYNDGEPQTMPVWCYLYPDHWNFELDQPLSEHKAGCDELVIMLERLGQRFGLYPFLLEKYGVAETGGGGGLGANMEHQTCSSMYRVDSYSDIMCHELAHQWWGDAVTCATWYDIWLNEGFASYSESLYREIKPGGGFGSYLSRVRARRPTNPDARVYRTDISSDGAIFSGNDVYNKGSWVLHMLRHVMGDAAFFDAIADYRAAYFDGSATTAQFTARFSQSFGRDLSWFVDEWVMNPGSPRYEYAWRAAQAGAQNYVQLQIAQTQQAQGFGLNTMPIDIVATTSGGSTTYVVWSLHATDHFAIPVDGVPTAVEFDPDPGSFTVPPTRWVLAKSLAQTIWPDPSPVVTCQGDMDENGAINGLDIQPFVNALIDAGTYPAAWQRGDMNFDGQCNPTDLPLFVEALLGQRICPR